MLYRKRTEKTLTV